MKVSDVMTRRIISVSSEATILEAIKLMLKHHIGGLPVIGPGGKLVGIVTESDFLHRPETGTERKPSRWLDALLGPADAAQDYVRSHGLKVRDVMTRNPVAVPENTPLDEVVRVMEARKIKRLLVMRRSKVVGIVSRADLMLAVASIDRAAPAPRDSDAAIRDRIMAAIREQSWTAGAFVDVNVRNGIADIWGRVSEMAQREALNVLVASAPGVKRVENHLTWQGEPASGDVTPAIREGRPSARGRALSEVVTSRSRKRSRAAPEADSRRLSGNRLQGCATEQHSDLRTTAIDPAQNFPEK